MKKIYLFFLIVLFAGSNAQIVNIPDANFKAMLLAADVTNSIAKGQYGSALKIDANSNGQIEIFETLAVYELSLTSSNIADFTGISSFPTLIKFRATGNSASTLNLSAQPNLQDLFLNYNLQLNNLILHSAANLYRVEIYYTSLTSLSFQNMSNLETLYIQNTPVSTLNISGSTMLEQLMLEHTQLNSFSVTGLQSPAVIAVRNNPLLSSVSISNSPVEIIYVNNNALTSLNIQDLPILGHINLANNQLTGFTILNCPALQSIYCNTNLLTNLNTTSFANLSYLDCSNNQISSLDLSSNALLDIIFCSGNNMDYLNLKNGKTHSPNGIGFHTNPNLVICSDDSELTMFQNAISSNTYAYQNQVATSYCSFTPGGTYYTFQGQTQYDIDSNGCTVNDPFKPFQKVNITNGSANGNIISNTSGNYFIPVQAGTHTITPILENPTYFTISPASFSANFPAQSSPLTQNFCITANGNHNDLEIAIIPITAAVPGFTSKYRIIYKNKGTAAQYGNLAFSYDDNLMNFTTATVAPASQSTGTLNWNFTNLLPFETREVTLSFTLNTPVATPPLTGGHILNYTAQVTGATDETPADNSFTLNQTAVNSFDPNDKSCLQGTAIAQAQVGDYVHYLIRFENTGTASAQNVVVKDVIDTSKFNLSSLVAVGGSHSFVTRITGPNTVEFIFENIQLPFADATNDGYLVFKIKTLTNLTVGNAFSNTANIYFDYNAPIVTNTYTTTVQSNLSTYETLTENLSIYPNPVKDVLHFKTKERIVKAEVYDLSGRIVLSSGIIQNATDLSGLSKGNYLIRIYTKDQFIIKKLIKE